MNGDLTQGSAAQNVLQWGVKKAKLALALAVIKSRPPGKSGRLHAEDLAVKLRGQDEALRTKIQGLQEEVYRLQQELLLTKLLSKPSKQQNESGDGFMDAYSQDLMGSINDQLNSDLDSGCGTESSTEALLPSQSSPDTNIRQLLPPGPLLPPLTLSEGSPQGRSLLLHMQFLQSVCALQRVGCEGGGDAAALNASDTLVVGDSVCQLLSSVVGICQDSQPLPPPPLLRQAACVAARAMEFWSPLGSPSSLAVKHGEDALKELVGLLIHNVQLNRNQAQEGLTGCLVLLGGSSLLKNLLIRHVLSEIDRVADHLWHTCQGESDGPKLFDVALYENSFYLFWILEQLLQGAPDPRDSMGAGVISPLWTPEQKAVLGHLHSRALLLSDEFPLFALYLWRLSGLLPPSNTCTT